MAIGYTTDSLTSLAIGFVATIVPYCCDGRRSSLLGFPPGRRGDSPDPPWGSNDGVDGRTPLAVRP